MDKFNLYLDTSVYCLNVQEVGHELVLRRGRRVVFGTVVAVSADNPASSAVGGFKEGSSAYRFCRQCLITIGKIRSVVSNSDVWCSMFYFITYF